MKKVKKIVLFIFVISLITGCTFSDLFVRENPKEETVYLKGKHNVELKIKEYGIVQLELDADKAPITVTNFINLVENKFYDGLTFHRIMKGFMAQGGDPSHNGTGGSEKKIKGEFLANGIDNDIKHERGVISMARGSNDYNSASSQFFIVHEDSFFLDNYYAAFGHVTKGMEIIDKICNDAIVEDDNGTVLFKNQPVIEYIKKITNN